MTDGTREYNAEHYRLSTFYDLAKTAVIRLAFAQGKELAPHGCTAVALTPGWMRSEMMLENYGVTEANWRDGAAVNPHFAAISESPRFVGRAVAALAADPEVAPSQRRLVLLRRPRARVRLHRSRRLPARLLALHGRGPGRGPPGGPDRLPLSPARDVRGQPSYPSTVPASRMLVSLGSRPNSSWARRWRSRSQ